MKKLSQRLNHVLSPTGRVMQAVGRAWDYVLVGLCWLLASLPLISAGAAAAALYTVVFRMLDGRDEHLLREFVTAFRENFRQATVLWLLQLLLGAFLALDGYFYLLWAAAGELPGQLLLAVFLLAALIYLFASAWLYAYIAKFRCGNRAAVKAAVVLSLRFAPYTLLMLIAKAALLAGGLLTGFLFLLAPGASAFLNGWCIRRVFRRYTSEPSAARSGVPD